MADGIELNSFCTPEYRFTARCIVCVETPVKCFPFGTGFIPFYPVLSCFIPISPLLQMPVLLTAPLPAAFPAPRLAKASRTLHAAATPLARTRFSRPKPPPPPRPNVRKPTQKTHHNTSLRITPPIAPAAASLACPDDHPLWQFFHNRSFIRSSTQCDTTARPWAIPELRRKSFNDLHSLWYICLRERNVLAREIHLVRTGLRHEIDAFQTMDERIRTTMWRIRHVLSERQWAFTRAAEGPRLRQQFIADFESHFLQGTTTTDESTTTTDESKKNNNDNECWEKLKRFQLAVFGIDEAIDENVVNRNFVEGLKFIANLKLKKFSATNNEIATIHKQLHPITDVGEAFVLFSCENNEQSTLEAAHIVTDLRKNGNSVPPDNEIKTVKTYLNELIRDPTSPPPPPSS